MPKMQERESETNRKLVYCFRHPRSSSATHTDVGLYGTNLSAQMADGIFKLTLRSDRFARVTYQLLHYSVRETLNVGRYMVRLRPSN